MSRESNDYQDHFDEGTAARLAGKVKSSNPYKRSVVPAVHGAWDDGWEAANQELTKST
jgi:hypothetical protein